MSDGCGQGGVEPRLIIFTWIESAGDSLKDGPAKLGAAIGAVLVGLGLIPVAAVLLGGTP